jgi:glutathione S-transferase
MLKILGRPTSINVRKVLWLCAELDLPCEQEMWGEGFRSPKTPEFLALNPNGLVPVVRDGDFVLWESNAICRYLAAKHGRGDLLPPDLQQRAVVEQWMDWSATQVYVAWRYAFMSLVRKNPQFADPAAAQASVESWNRHMALLEAQLSRTGGFAAGDTFTLADIPIGLVVHRWFMMPMSRPSLAAVEAYYERLSERPGFMLHVRNGVP